MSAGHLERRSFVCWGETGLKSYRALTRRDLHCSRGRDAGAIAVEGATMLMVAGNSMGTNWKGQYTTSLLEF